MKTILKKINNITGIETKEKRNTFKDLNERDISSKIKGIFKSYEKKSCKIQ